MNEASSKKGSAPASGRRARRMIVFVGFLIPALPIAVWFQSIVPIYRSMWHGPMLILYLPARALGLVGFVLMVYQFVLSSRFLFIENAFSRAVVYRRHRTLGMIGFLLILLHGTAMLAFDLIVAGRIVFDIPKIVGIVALFLLTIAVGAAVFWKPLKLTNRQWMRIHRLAYLVFPLAFYHAISVGTTLNTSGWVMGLFYVLTAVYLVVVGRRIRQEIATRRKKMRRPGTSDR